MTTTSPLARTLILATLAMSASAAPTTAMAQITSLDLNNYEHSATYALPRVAASEASAVTYNWDTGTLFVLGDEGEAIVEVDAFGNQLSVMELTGFGDTEGLTYTGSGRFVLTEERDQDLYALNYAGGGSVARSTLQVASIGPNVGNQGLEGVSFDPVTGRYLMVKEKGPQAVYDTAVTFTDPPAGPDLNPTSIFDPALLGVGDLSDIQALSTVDSLLGTVDAENLLIFSQESRVLLEVDRLGAVLSRFNFSSIAGDAEGVTIGADGTIYVVGEAPELYVLTPVPAPGPLAALVTAGVLLAGRRRR